MQAPAVATATLLERRRQPFARWDPHRIAPGRAGTYAVWIDGELACVSVASDDLGAAIDRVARGDRTVPFVAWCCEHYVEPRLRLDHVLAMPNGGRLLDRLTAATLLERGALAWWYAD